MSVYTPVSEAELKVFLRQYSIGELIEYEGIAAGIENTNFFVTTGGGRFVLTLFEQHTLDELEYFLALMKHLAEADIPTPYPLATREGQLLSHLNGKPAALVRRLPGHNLECPTAAQCAEIGEVLARLHVAGQSFPLKRAPDRGHDWRVATAEQLLPLLDEENADLLRTEIIWQGRIPFAQLPAGTIHADLFRDNALFHEGHLSGVIDLYFACTDSWLYDLAVVVNDWCCLPDGALDQNLTQACLQSYRRVRPWENGEERYWPAMLRAAALRFWLSRLAVRFDPRPGELTLQKDPAEFRAKLLQRIHSMPEALEITVNARRLLCPMPVIRVQEAVDTLPPGAKVTAVCTDPGALHDIPAWARIHGHQVLETHVQNREYVIVLQTGGSA